MDSLVQTPAQLGIHLCSRRRALKLTQAQAAGAIGLSQKRMSALEQKPERLTVQQLLGLAAALELEVVLRERSPRAAAAPDSW
jgi:HTH-type transcriptional regulator/antitoxin HipB